mgnify:CR=1 FL=1
MRIGHGYDVHKFGGEGPLTIAGVKIEEVATVQPLQQ